MEFDVCVCFGCWRCCCVAALWLCVSVANVALRCVCVCFFVYFKWLLPHGFGEDIIISSASPPLASGVLPEVEWAGETSPRGPLLSQLQGLFNEKKRDTSMSFKDIVGTGRAAWRSPSTECELRSIADVQLAMTCKAAGQWECTRTSWLALLARTPRLCVQHLALGEGWFFALGDVGGGAMSLWPASMVQAPTGSQLFCLRLDMNECRMRVGPIMDLAGWRAFATHGCRRHTCRIWVSTAPSLRPCRATLRKGSLPLAPERPSAPCRSRSFGISPAMSSSRCRGGASLFDTVWSLMRWALPAESEDNLWRYMEKRWHSPNILESVLNDGVLDQVSERILTRSARRSAS